MISDLDSTLEALLTNELPSELVGQVAISFATPDGSFPPTSVSLPAIDLFLYDVRENRDLRSNEWIVNRKSDGTAVKQPPPVRVECSYLITAWSRDTVPDPAAEEHQLLGEVMKVLLCHATIPDAVLQGSLAGQRPALPAVTLQPGRLQSMGEFWQALGGKPKAALNYTVTIALPVRDSVETGVVTDKLLRFEQESETSS
jgi:hypothetical protein